MRKIIIGDVHGCFEELVELLDACDYDVKEDKLIFVGDLINKGPESLSVLDLVDSTNADVVLGNHEVAFLKYLEGNENFVSKGFEQVKAQMGERLLFWESWLKSRPYYLEYDDCIVVHAGLQPEVKLENTSPSILTKIRTWDGSGDDMNNPSNPPWHKFYKGKKLVVYGHFAAQGLHILENSIGLDSGCCWGGSLSALILPSREIIQVKAKKAYFVES